MFCFDTLGWSIRYPVRRATHLSILRLVVVSHVIPITGQAQVQQQVKPKGSEPTPEPAAAAILAAFEKYEVVGLPKAHGMKDVDDFILSLIRNPVFAEKVNDIAVECGNSLGLTTHQPFLLPAAAASLLENIRRSLPRSGSIPTSADVAISPAVGETLGSASDLREKLQSKEVTPLHLLAALLAATHNGVQALRDAGITEEDVLDAIRRKDQLEHL